MVIRFAVAILLLASCNPYSPDFIDCKVHCGPDSTCPAGRECKQGWCRPPNTTNSCDCSPGDVRACGGGKGECKPGSQTCTLNGGWGQCLGETKSTPEVCDGKDNDCNGVKDDLVNDAPMCPKSVGVCATARQECVNGSYPGTCEVSAYGNDYQASETRCDSKDNDCDGVVDGKPSKALAVDVSDFVLAEYDGGFSVVGVQELPASDGGSGFEYRLSLLRLDAQLSARGPPVSVAPPQDVPFYFGARTTPTGDTYVVWGTRAVDAGFNLTLVDGAGTVRAPISFPDTERAGPFSIGVSASKVTIAWPAHFRQVARVATYLPADAGVTMRDFNRLSDGGFNAASEVFALRISPTGKALGVFAQNSVVDAGSTNVALVVELDGARTATTNVSSGLVFVEVGSLIQAAWLTNSPGFQLFGFDPESGLRFKNDVFASAVSIVKTQANTDIKSGAAGRGLNSAALIYIDKNVAGVLATPFGNGTQFRTRLFPSDGGILADLQLGHPGGPDALIGVVWRNTLSGPGELTGTMTCQP